MPSDSNSKKLPPSVKGITQPNKAQWEDIFEHCNRIKCVKVAEETGIKYETLRRRFQQWQTGDKEKAVKPLSIRAQKPKELTESDKEGSTDEEIDDTNPVFGSANRRELRPSVAPELDNIHESATDSDSANESEQPPKKKSKSSSKSSDKSSSKKKSKKSDDHSSEKSSHKKAKKKAESLMGLSSSQDDFRLAVLAQIDKLEKKKIAETREAADAARAALDDADEE